MGKPEFNRVFCLFIDSRKPGSHKLDRMSHTFLEDILFSIARDYFPVWQEKFGRYFVFRAYPVYERSIQFGIMLIRQEPEIFEVYGTDKPVGLAFDDSVANINRLLEGKGPKTPFMVLRMEVEFYFSLLYSLQKDLFWVYDKKVAVSKFVKDILVEGIKGFEIFSFLKVFVSRSAAYFFSVSQQGISHVASFSECRKEGKPYVVPAGVFFFEYRPLSFRSAEAKADKVHSPDKNWLYRLGIQILKDVALSFLIILMVFGS